MLSGDDGVYGAAPVRSGLPRATIVLLARKTRKSRSCRPSALSRVHDGFLTAGLSPTSAAALATGARLNAGGAMDTEERLKARPPVLRCSKVLDMARCAPLLTD